MLLSLDFPRDGEVLEPSGIQARPELDPRRKHSGVTPWCSRPCSARYEIVHLLFYSSLWHNSRSPGLQPGGNTMKRVELRVGDKTIEGTLVDFETVREEYNSYKLSDGSMIRMKTVVTNIIRTEEFTPTGEPIYVVNSQNVLVADVPDGLKKPAQIQ